MFISLSIKEMESLISEYKFQGKGSFCAVFVSYFNIFKKSKAEIKTAVLLLFYKGERQKEK